ncbi:hypothetical protein FOL46_004290 [Perkinsus olseni]|uniref:Intraflagellar transport protein 74 n=1 Tax=Perkinsus olseni TaxID=32597 RepID=A0A7J6LZY4_PEROL|nr:hypothetical protein FOL46_004290 [Perkinsus olseni]
MADRPQSRGFNTTGGGFRPAPPPQVGSSSPARPSSAMRSTGGSSSGTPASQRGSIFSGAAAGSRAGLGTGYVAPSATASSTTMDGFRVVDRPVTQQGLSGVRTAQSSSGRQVLDKSYYKAQLRNKINSLSSEIAQFNKEMARIAEESQSYRQYQRRYQSLLDEVKGLEGELADYNLALDKQRISIRPEDLERQYLEIKEKNAFGREQIDNVFLEKKECEEGLARLEHELIEQQSHIEQQLSRLTPELKREYEQLIGELQKINDASHELEASMEPMQQRLKVTGDRLEMDPSRRRMLALSKARDDLLQRKMELTDELEKVSLPLPKQKEMLMEKIKDDNQKMAELESAHEGMKEALERFRRNAAEISAALNRHSEAGEAEADDEQQQKYKILFAKDAEMTAFLEGFPKLEEDERGVVKGLEGDIKNLMIKIHKVAYRQTLHDDFHRRRSAERRRSPLGLGLRKCRVEASETTGQRLELEVQQRRDELQKISDLEHKVEEELAQAEESMAHYQAEIDNRFSCVDELRKTRLRDMEILAERKQKLEHDLPGLRDLVESAQLRLDGKRQTLSESTGHAALVELEETLKKLEQTRYQQESSIQGNLQESDYHDENVHAMNMVNKINEIVKKQAHIVIQPGRAM